MPVRCCHEENRREAHRQENPTAASELQGRDAGDGRAGIAPSSPKHETPRLVNDIVPQKRASGKSSEEFPAAIRTLNTWGFFPFAGHAAVHGAPAERTQFSKAWQSVAKVPWYEGKSAAGFCSSSARSEEDGDPGDLLRRTTKPTTLGGRLCGHGGQHDQYRRRNKKTSVARRVTRRASSLRRKKARRARHCVPGAATRYAIGPKARNAACVTFATGR